MGRLLSGLVRNRSIIHHSFKHYKEWKLLPATLILPTPFFSAAAGCRLKMVSYGVLSALFY